MSNAYIAQLRAQFANEVTAHKTEIAAMLLSEGNPLQTCEALLNRCALMRANGHPTYSIMDMLVKSRFYGPINRLGLKRLVTKVRAHPSVLEHLFATIDEVMAGSDTIMGFTDQGLKSDPNGRRKPRIDMGGNVYNDWDGGGIGHVKAAKWRQQFEAAALRSTQNDGGLTNIGNDRAD